MIDPYTCYVRYLAMKNHFTQWKYDYFTYRGYVKTNLEAFENRRDKAQFYTLSRKKMPLDVLLGNLSRDPQKSMREINQDTDAYDDYQRRVFSMTYLFRNEISELDPDWDNNFRVEKGRHPLLIRAYLANKIGLETASIALNLSGYTPRWEAACKDDLLFNEMALRFIKYHSFLKYKKDVFSRIIIDGTNSSAKYTLTA